MIYSQWFQNLLNMKHGLKEELQKTSTPQSCQVLMVLKCLSDKKKLAQSYHWGQHPGYTYSFASEVGKVLGSSRVTKIPLCLRMHRSTHCHHQILQMDFELPRTVDLFRLWLPISFHQGHLIDDQVEVLYLRSLLDKS